MSLPTRLGLPGVLVLLLAVPAVRADDWPQWMGPQRDGVWRETGILEQFPAQGPKVRWRAEVAAGYSGPAVADGRVFVLDRVLDKGAKPPKTDFDMSAVPGSERVLCFGETDGKLLWKHEYPCTYAISYALGPRCTPTVASDKVYTLGAMGDLCCLSVQDGRVVWSKNFKNDYGVKAPLWGHSAHPLVDGNRLVCMVGGKGTTVVAFDKDSGKELWRSLSAGQPGYCPPRIDEIAGKRTLVVWDSDHVSGLDPETGKPYWSQDAKTYMAMSIAMPRQEKGTLFLTAAMGMSEMLRLADRPAANGEGKPEVVWKAKGKKTGLSSVFSTPFEQGGYIYGSTDDGVLCCIEAATGKRMWETRKPNNDKRLPSGDIFIVKHEPTGHFFLATENGDLIIADLTPQGYHERGRAHLVNPTTVLRGMGPKRDIVWSHPAFANRSVYARNDKELVCVSLAADSSK